MLKTSNMVNHNIDLSTFSLGDLLTLREEINAKIDDYVMTCKIAEIEKDVAEQGFSCQPSCHLEIANYKKVELPYYFYVYTYRKDKVDVDVAEYGHLQKDWVRYLNFTYQPQNDDNYVIVTDWDDVESPLRAIAKMEIPVYYKTSKLLPSSKFVVIYQEGNAYTGHLQDGDIHLDNGDVIASIDATIGSYENSNLLIVPYRDVRI